MVFHHASDIQLLKDYQCISNSEVMRELMREVFSLICDSLMNASYYLALLPILIRTFIEGREFALCFGKVLFLHSKELRVINLSSVRQCAVGLYTYIHAYSLALMRLWIDYLFYCEAGKPFARGTARDSQSFDSTLNRAMEFDFDAADFRKSKLAILYCKSRLRIGEAIIARAGAESRKSGFALLASDSAKERIESLIKSLENILQYLRMHRVPLRSNSFDFWKLVLLLFVRDTLSSYPVSVSSFLKARIIQLRTVGKRLFKSCDLSVRGIDSVAVGSLCYDSISHVDSPIVGIGEAQIGIASADLSRHHYSTKHVHSSTKSQLVPPRFIPRLKSRGLLATDG